MLICVIKLLIPSADTFNATFNLSLNDFLFNLIDWNFLIYKIFITNVTIWLITVAIAAPSTPFLKAKIKIGSKITFKIAPMTIDVIAYFGFPSALIIEFNVVPIIINGKPTPIIRP